MDQETKNKVNKMKVGTHINISNEQTEGTLIEYFNNMHGYGIVCAFNTSSSIIFRKERYITGDYHQYPGGS